MEEEHGEDDVLELVEKDFATEYTLRLRIPTRFELIDYAILLILF